MNTTLQHPGRRSSLAASKGITRRKFIQRGLTAASVLALPTIIPASARGANGSVPPSERITVGLIGPGLMGSGHLRVMAHRRDAQLLAVCDVDKSRRDRSREIADATYAANEPDGGYKGCAAYNDYRELLARPDIDAVLIATPDHWHSLQAIDAAKAGKDIYCEKPVSMTIQESRKLVEAVRRYGRVFQTGTQYRSIPDIRRVCQFIRDGRLGKVKSVFTLYHNIHGNIAGGRFTPFANVVSPDRCGKSYPPMDFALPAEPVPEGLDWDLWVGPAPWRPYNHLYHTNPSPGVVPWAFADAFGVTSSTWFLSHSADVIQWALGYENSGPVEIIHPGSGQFPTMTCRYANGTLLHLVDHWGQVKDLYQALPATARIAGNFGGVFIGERGWVTTLSTGGQIEGEPESLFEEMELKRTREVNIGANNHHANWLECIRSRKPPNADEEIGHRAASLGHLANIACWTGRSLKWDPMKEEFADCDAANHLRSRAMRSPWRM
ncbi:MAG: Gfo/Idh/MocA family oxidoreductase [Verrucomicrobia bacterium]|nr:Gfo/Idh/MocA family oxidoreductase [Verrucomicrobiota bacterium]